MPALECGVSRRVMRELEDAFVSDNWDQVAVRIREGRGTGVLFLAAWMLSEVSPQLSGNYYVFSGVGNYPRRRSPTRTDTRKGLRVRINRAIRANILEARNPKYESRVDGHAGDPPNAAPDPAERLDIPLIAWKPEKSDQDQVLIPTSWRNKGYNSQIHPTPTYRFNERNGSQIASLTELGELILNKHQSLENLVRPEIGTCWGNLNKFLQKQHCDTKEHYRFTIERLEKAMGRFTDQANSLCTVLGVKFDPSLALVLGD